MNEILAMREKRANLWDAAKKFRDAHIGEDGMMNAEDAATYDRMVADVDRMKTEIDRLERQQAIDAEMDMPTSRPVAGKPVKAPEEEKPGRAADEYRNAFWSQMRGKTSFAVQDALQVGELSEGGYLCPDEYEHQLIDALQDENVMRPLVNVIHTGSGDRRIPIVASHGSATWVEEEQQIQESDDAFTQVTLSAHKLATMIRVSRELLNDSAFDISTYIAREFVRRAAVAEEDAIINGNGSHKPVGMLHATLGAQVGVTAAATAAITTDELIDLQQSLKPAYRRKAYFVMNDATISAVRKLKDGMGQYIWKVGITEGAPDTIFNTRVIRSDSMPLPTAGNKAILYGDYSYYWLAEREGITLQRLNELYAATDQIGFKMTERLDGRLILPEAVKVLQMHA